MSPVEHKKRLRSYIKRQTMETPLKDKREQSDLIMRRLEESEQFRDAATVAAFWSMDDEPYTHEALKRWAKDKKVLLPMIEGEKMTFREYIPDVEMEQGALKTMHPKHGIRAKSSEIDMIVVPGVAFDRSGFRLGRGKGFYDRYLKRCHGVKVGVCLSHQLVDSVPTEPHDHRLDLVITPEQNIKVR